MSKKYIATGLLAGLTAGVGAGFILQQTGSAGAVAPAVVQQQDDDTTDASDTSDESTAVHAERGDRLREVLAPLVTDGTLTQAQLDAVVEALVEAGPLRGPGGPGHHGHGRRGARLDTVAEVLGTTVAELREQLRDGATIADIAGDQTQAVIDALVAEATEHINDAVADGRIPQDEADEKLSELPERVADLVNGVRPDAPADDDTGS